jgi:rod shape-determining protein MreC
VPEKTVRRRRAVLALLVVLALILITASFRSSGTGPLHSVQSGFLDIVSPIESGANKALTPVHDLFNAIDDVVNASSQRDKLQREYSALEARFVALQARRRESTDAAKILGLLRRDNLNADGPVGASITVEPQSLFANTIQIDAGSDSGVHSGDPVINGDGLVGTVSSVGATASSVTLIDDSTANEPAIDNANGELGIVSADPGNPNLLQMTNVANPATLGVGDFVVTAGSRRTDGASLLPPDIPIGMITSRPPQSDPLGSVTVTPLVNLGALGAVAVLTRVAS